MSLWKKLTALVLTLALVAGGAALALSASAEEEIAPAEPASAEPFVPVLRFVSASDTHVRDLSLIHI